MTEHSATWDGMRHARHASEGVLSGNLGYGRERLEALLAAGGAA